MKIAVVKETRQNEKRVSVIPEVVKRLCGRGVEVCVEAGAGVASGFSDADYINAGATIARDKPTLFKNADIVSWLKRPVPEQESLDLISPKAIVTGFLDPLKPDGHVQRFTGHKLTTMSFELLPQNEKTAEMDCFAAMGVLAGEIATKDACTAIAARGMTPRVLVIGAGSAGIASAQKSHALGYETVVCSTSERFKRHIEDKLHLRFEKLPSEVGTTTPAKICAQRDQQKTIEQIVKDWKPNVIITTARRPGERAPMLLSKRLIKSIEYPTIIEDLTASIGGNTAFTKVDSSVNVGNVTINNRTNYPSKDPELASAAYAYCFMHIIEHMLGHKLNADTIGQDDILHNCVMTHNGKITHAGVASAQLQHAAQKL